MSILASVEAWHSPMKASRFSKAAVSDTGGAAPAPIDAGLKNASMAASEPLPGPQVPPTAGFGNDTTTAEMAIPAAISARTAKTVLILNSTLCSGTAVAYRPIRPSVVRSEKDVHPAERRKHLHVDEDLALCDLQSLRRAANYVVAFCRQHVVAGMVEAVLQ